MPDSVGIFKSVTRCSVCKQQIFGVMARNMGVIYYDSTKGAMVQHAHVDKKGKPVAWEPITVQEGATV